MAIRFVDVEPAKGGGAEPTPHRRGRVQNPVPPRSEQAVEALPAETDPSAGDVDPGDAAEAASPFPALPHAKPEPKPRGRKKPMSAAGADVAKGKAPDSSAPLLEGLLPEPQAHAKPTAKPRGRRKAFG